jgi:rhomboid-related protein 1/2/3
VIQIIFGLPLNMVHGSVRFGFIYQLGVIGGALCFGIDGAHGAVVGCSGGVYCIFGMHLAELIMNGDADNKGLLNK